MKKIFLTLTALALLSCDEDFDINRNPDNLTPEEISLEKQLPAGIIGVAAAEGSYYALIGGFWAQYWTQGNSSNQYKNVDEYSISSVDYTAGWAAMYDALGDLKSVKKAALEEENWNYYLIATTLQVQASQVLVDFYDQTPYVESNSTINLQPRFNTGQEAYDLMEADLKDALSRNLTESKGNTPAKDDFVFGGAMSNWTAYANTLLLKLYMRQTEVRPSLAQAGITALYNSGATFLNRDAAITQFEDAPDRSNPLFESDRRQLNTKINLRASKTSYSFLEDNNDTRIANFFEAGNPLNQGDFNSTVAQTSIAVIKLSATSPVYFMSREESLFLQAEALERYFAGAGAKEIYDEAVKEAFTKWSKNGTTYVAAGGAYEYPSAGTFNEKLEAIITQKWIAGFPGNGFESFFEQNRTGFPQVSAVPQTNAAYIPGQLSYSINGVTGGLFPKRIQYPNTVRTRNPNAPALVPLTTPVWWDVN